MFYSLMEFLRELKRRWIYIVLAVILGAIIGFFMAGLKVDAKSAIAQLWVDIKNDPDLPFDTTESKLNNAVQILKLDEYLGKCFKECELTDETKYSSGNYTRRVIITRSGNVISIQVSLEGDDAGKALLLCDKVFLGALDVYSEDKPEELIKEGQIRRYMGKDVSVRVASTPQEYEMGVSENLSKAMKFALLSLVLGVTVIAVRRFFDTRIFCATELLENYEFPVLGSLDDFSKEDQRLENYRLVRSNLESSLQRISAKSVYVASDCDSLKSSEKMFEVAQEMAMQNESVLFIDCQKSSCLKGELLLPYLNKSMVTDAVVGKVTTMTLLEEDTLSSEFDYMLKNFIKDQKSRFDKIILCGDSLDKNNSPIVFADMTDATIVAFKLKRSHHKVVKNLLRIYDINEVKVIGSIIL